MDNKILAQHIEMENGNTYVMNAEGCIEGNIGEIESVGIKRLTDVLEHRVNTILGSRSHMVRFVNGGVLEYAYNGEGQLIELSSTGLFVSVSKDNEILYYVE